MFCDIFHGLHSEKINTNSNISNELQDLPKQNNSDSEADTLSDI